MKVIVIGGGWAGMAAAVELSRHNITVTVIEASGQLGGRARNIVHRGLALDNGQHLLLGAYRETLRLLRVMGIAEEQMFLRRPLQLHMRGTTSHIRLTTPALPHPLHLILGLAGMRGLSVPERVAALRLCANLARGNQPAQDIPVARWLDEQRQPTRLIEALWNPLCLASLNTPIDHASAHVFIRVLRDGFLQRRHDSDMLFPRRGLGSSFPEPAAHFITHHGGHILYSTRANSLQIYAGRICGVSTSQGDIAADHVIVAVPPAACHRLISPHPELHTIAEHIKLIEHEPVCTVYLQYPAETRAGTEMIGMLETTGQWLFDLTHTGKPGWMAVVISGAGPHLLLDNTDLLKKISAELAQLMPHWPAPQDGVVIREKRATFSCRPGIAALRPQAQTPVQGCWLAGDYTATGYPATLEGAVISGVRSARAVLSV